MGGPGAPLLQEAPGVGETGGPWAPLLQEAPGVGETGGHIGPPLQGVLSVEKQALWGLVPRPGHFPGSPAFPEEREGTEPLPYKVFY